MEGYPAQESPYFFQNRCPGQLSPVSEVVKRETYFERLNRRLREMADREILAPHRCLGFIHHTQPDGTTIPVSMVVEEPNGEWVNAPVPQIEISRPVSVTKSSYPARNGRDFCINIGVTNFNVGENELRSLCVELAKQFP